MAPKKNQKVKMSLNDFIATPEVATPGGSWADDDVVEDLPTAQSTAAARDEFGGRLDGSADVGRPFGADTRDRPVVPLPTAPPFTAFLGNLNHSILEEEIESFFGELNVTSVRIVKDISDRPKGFGYAEFDSLDDLKAALGKTGQQLAARPVRVTVAEPPKKGGFGGSFVDDKDAWRSSRPAADLEPVNTDADDNVNWRGTARPVAPPRSERGFGFKGGAPVDVDNKEWTRGSNFKSSPPVSQSSTDDVSNWRSARPAPAAQSAAPGERRKLQLAPRGSTQGASSNQSAPSKPSPFGGARPVDTATREQSLLERSKAPAATGKPSSVAQPEKKKVRNHDNKFSFANAGLEVEGEDDDE
ncbi:hypothetical protein E3Q23_02801 [Wallemia mellicola]|uniref:RRM domain-containing protein n=1 Tax=Wallemia mellicola TaxID=1708541 RepID=A0A4T0SY49_9BASI|nr:hypothetical protein E3Q24_04033 [Wallemia mellicola]TIB74112.1 hypothetical protein E3Q23_02801 [Wallemia mellicola]TIB83338.1 hypothetical protein E3Q21_02976 [Wallemia mellicola]TIB86192.1 hypothetical protein E3Q20_02968 [Wallemia mellicola]TIB98608.1 hypothetical protein E3Q17_02942 [Wallemia mellicola]